MAHTIENKWKIESLRLTSFLQKDFNGNNLESWLTEISNSAPLSIIRNVNYFQGLVMIESRMLKVEWNRDRIDIVLNSNAPSTATNIGNFSLIAALMEGLIFKFLEIKEWPESKRLALGVILNAQIDSVENGIELLASNLKYVSGLHGSSDFMYRINKPIQSNYKSQIWLNRLMTWSIGQLQLLDFQINTPGQNFQQPIVTRQPELICRLELDFNSAESSDFVLPISDQQGIAKELLVEAVNVAEKGEHGLR